MLLSCSYILTIRAENVISVWENKKNYKIESDQQFALKMIKRIKSSIAINPMNADGYLLLARYFELLSNTEQKNLAKLTNSENQDYGLLAEQAYFRTITNQPTSDYAWARLANFYSNNPAVDDAKVIQVLINAIKLGPYEYENQKVIIPLIFKYWDQLPLAEILKPITHSLKFYSNANANAQLTLSSAKKYDKLNELEPYIKKKSLIKKFNNLKQELQSESNRKDNGK
jgi:hypothetical protein